MKEDDNSIPRAVSVNHWSLTAQMVETAAMRFSPAGIPALDCVLEHQSEVIEAGAPRKVQLQLKALAIGPIAEQLSRQPLGIEARFEGFLGSTTRSRQSASRSSSVVFHVQSFAIGNQH